MSGFEKFILGYENVLHGIAEFTVSTLELVGICIILLGAAKTIWHTVGRLKKKQPINIIVEFGNTLAIALEFKMGAEIVNTVIIRDLKELGVLAIVIALRTVLAILLHWEIKNEKNAVRMEQGIESAKNDGESRS